VQHRTGKDDRWSGLQRSVADLAQVSARLAADQPAGAQPGPHNRHQSGSRQSALFQQLPDGDDIVDAYVPYLAVKPGGKPVENSVASQARRVQVADANDVQTVHLLDDVRPAILAEKDRSRAKCAQGRNPTLKRCCAALVKRN